MLEKSYFHQEYLNIYQKQIYQTYIILIIRRYTFFRFEIRKSSNRSCYTIYRSIITSISITKSMLCLVYYIFQSLFQQYHLQFGDISLLLFLVTFLLGILILLLVCSGSESKNNYSFLLNPFPTKLINYLPLFLFRSRYFLAVGISLYFAEWYTKVDVGSSLNLWKYYTISFIRINFKRDLI